MRTIVEHQHPPSSQLVDEERPRCAEQRLVRLPEKTSSPRRWERIRLQCSRLAVPPLMVGNDEAWTLRSRLLEQDTVGRCLHLRRCWEWQRQNKLHLRPRIHPIDRDDCMDRAPSGDEITLESRRRRQKRDEIVPSYLSALGPPI